MREADPASLWEITLRFGPNLPEEADKIMDDLQQFMCNHDAYYTCAELRSYPRRTGTHRPGGK